MVTHNFDFLNMVTHHISPFVVTHHISPFLVTHHISPFLVTNMMTHHISPAQETDMDGQVSDEPSLQKKTIKAQSPTAFNHKCAR